MDNCGNVIGKFIRRQAFGIAIVLSAVAACLWPEAFDTWGGVSLLSLISPTIGLIMFGMGTTLTLADFQRVAKMPAGVFVGVFLQFLVMPCVGFMLAKLFGFDGELAAGVILVGSVAGGTASNVISYLAKANVALSVTMTCCSTLLSPFLTPLLMKGLAGKFIAVDAGAMMWGILKIVIFPVLGGLLAHTLLKKQFDERKNFCDRVLSIFSSVGICFTIVVLTAQSQAKFREAGLLVFCVAVLHNSIGYLSGYWITRYLSRFFKSLTMRDARTVAIEVGLQNGGMAGALANEVLHSAVAALPANIFSIWMNFSGSILASWWSRDERFSHKGIESVLSAIGGRFQRSRRLWIGLLLANLSIMFVWYFISLFCSSNALSGWPHNEKFQSMMMGAMVVLGVLTLLIAFGGYWLRWCYYLLLVAVMLLITAFVLPGVDRMFAAEKWTIEATFAMVALFVSFVACPVAIVLLATGKQQKVPS